MAILVMYIYYVCTSHLDGFVIVPDVDDASDLLAGGEAADRVTREGDGEHAGSHRRFFQLWFIICVVNE